MIRPCGPTQEVEVAAVGGLQDVLCVERFVAPRWRSPWTESLAAALYLSRFDQDVEASPLYVEMDRIPVAKQGKWSSYGRFGRDM